MIRVVFVCLGNICRSPMAEAVFRHLVKERGYDKKIKVDSAGTSNWHINKRPHIGTLDKLEKYNISSENMYARQFRKEDGEKFDYIVAMDQSNYDNIVSVLGSDDCSHVFKLLDLTEVENKDVPDPYYTGDFEETYQLVLDGSERLLEKIIKEHQL